MFGVLCYAIKEWIIDSTRNPITIVATPSISRQLDQEKVDGEDS